MNVRKLAVDGALEFTPEIFNDQRGTSVQSFRAEAFSEAVGRPLFAVKQVLNSKSRRGVVRGIHFTATPPGSEKYVYCLGGAALDIVIDVRVGSPTFGQWDSVRLDQRDCRSMYFPVGVGHAFIALEDDTTMCYLLSNPYRPELEIALSPLDPELGLPLPDFTEPTMSDRDRDAITLAQARAAGLLPDYVETTALTGRLPEGSRS
jgi:5-epimerase